MKRMLILYNFIVDDDKTYREASATFLKCSVLCRRWWKLMLARRMLLRKPATKQPKKGMIRFVWQEHAFKDFSGRIPSSFWVLHFYFHCRWKCGKRKFRLRSVKELKKQPKDNWKNETLPVMWASSTISAPNTENAFTNSVKVAT